MDLSDKYTHLIPQPHTFLTLDTSATLASASRTTPLTARVTGNSCWTANVDNFKERSRDHSESPRGDGQGEGSRRLSKGEFLGANVW
jgi:hypothetical protein